MTKNKPSSPKRKSTRTASRARSTVSIKATAAQKATAKAKRTSSSLTKNSHCDLCILIAILAATCIFAWWYFKMLDRLTTPIAMPSDRISGRTGGRPATSKINVESLTTEQVSGIYQVQLPAADTAGRQLTLSLTPAGEAVFLQDYQNGQDPLISTGVWSLADGLITVSTPEPMTFAVGADSLTLVDYDQDEWGSQGLTLTKSSNSRDDVSDAAIIDDDLFDHTWFWLDTTKGDGATVTPRHANAFTLTFSAGGTVNIQTDCNNGRGTYTTSGDSSLKFGAIAATQMFCANSQENIFNQDLAQVTSYVLDDHDLTLFLAQDAGQMHFSAE